MATSLSTTLAGVPSGARYYVMVVPRVSVIVVKTANDPVTVDDLVTGLPRLQAQQTELIVASGDRSEMTELQGRRRDLRCVVGAADVGPRGLREAAAREATGHIVTIVDASAALDRSWQQAMLGLGASSNEAVLVP